MTKEDPIIKEKDEEYALGLAAESNDYKINKATKDKLKQFTLTKWKVFQ